MLLLPDTDRMMKLLRSWTITQAMQIGLVAGLLALILWPAYAIFQDPLRLPFAASLAASAFCGLSILAITITDLLFHRARGRRLRPIRVFDIVLGVSMTLPGLMALPGILR